MPVTFLNKIPQLGVLQASYMLHRLLIKISCNGLYPHLGKKKWLEQCWVPFIRLGMHPSAHYSPHCSTSFTYISTCHLIWVWDPQSDRHRPGTQYWGKQVSLFVIKRLHVKYRTKPRTNVTSSTVISTVEPISINISNRQYENKLKTST